MYKDNDECCNNLGTVEQKICKMSGSAYKIGEEIVCVNNRGIHGDRTRLTIGKSYTVVKSKTPPAFYDCIGIIRVVDDGGSVFGYCSFRFRRKHEFRNGMGNKNVSVRRKDT